MPFALVEVGGSIHFSLIVNYDCEDNLFGGYPVVTICQRKIDQVVGPVTAIGIDIIVHVIPSIKIHYGNILTSHQEHFPHT